VGASEYTFDEPTEVSNYLMTEEVFVDSSWRPPLELPTEPTWGVVIFGRDDTYLSLPRRFAVRGDHLYGVGFNGGTQNLKIETVRAFFALTDEQVTQIEAAR
jgi:hypothetical protein